MSIERRVYVICGRCGEETQLFDGEERAMPVVRECGWHLHDTVGGQDLCPRCAKQEQEKE